MCYSKDMLPPLLLLLLLLLCKHIVTYDEPDLLKTQEVIELAAKSTVRDGHGDLEHVLDTHYKRHERPFQRIKPVIVQVNVYVLSLSDFSARHAYYQMDIYLRQRWKDPRLAQNFSKLISINSLRDKIWVPDLFFVNARSANRHIVTTPNLLVWVDTHGTVIFSQKLSLLLSCKMNLRYFPHDAQLCYLDISSYGYGISDLQLQWWYTGDGHNVSSVTLDPDLELNEFDRPEVRTGNCSDFSIITGQFSCLRGRFSLRRQLGFYLINTYVPSFLVVATAWLSFFIDHQSAPARVSLCLLSFLALMTQTSAILSSLPPVSYTKAIDVWLFTCLAFVTFALIEYAVVNVISKHFLNYERNREQKRRSMMLKQIKRIQNEKDQELQGLHYSSNDDSFSHPVMNQVRKSRARCCGNQSSMETLAPINWVEKVEKMSKIIFALFFFAFVFFYWVYFVKRMKTLNVFDNSKSCE